jgi:transglutaminase-like putative cysteine protease
VKEDGSLRFDALTYRGMTYRVESEIPDPDLEVLGRTEDGTLSPVFADAATEGVFAAEDEAEVPEPRNVDDPLRYLALPPEIDPGVALLAAEQTQGLATDFERALALEAFFRSPGRFRYSIDIEPGHGADDLAEWLLDPQSPSYRTGYCEQFAASMAVMARQLGIPSRVVLGFAPGDLLEDGRVVVRDRNAHAWVELWMPTQGWVRFDPTPRSDGTNPATLGGIPFDVRPYLAPPEPESAQDVLPGADRRPLDDEPDFGDLPRFRGPVDEDTPGLQIPGWLLPGILASLGVFGLLPAVKWARRRHRRRRLAAGDVSAAWRDIVDRLSDLGADPPVAATPREVAAATDPAMRPLADVYGRSVYGPPGRLPEARVALASRAFEETNDRLSQRYSWFRRLASWYRLRSIMPAGLRKRDPH